MKGAFDRKGFCQRLAQAYYHSGLTGAQLENLTGVSRYSIGAYLRGEFLPGLQTFDRMCRAFGVNAHWLLTGEGRAPEWI